jgi:metal-responsive CopG/Arc/MetJ family transcriptional regulator
MTATNLSDEPKRAEHKRLSINLPTPVFDELQHLAEASHRSMTELIRDAFALAKIAYEETGQGNKIAITDRSGRTLKELVILR